ncbi:MAG: hypothetical protein IIY02_05535 [Firmicutes bacterium]|nr:hypothetical protein [Bacillota bacterium]
MEKVGSCMVVLDLESSLCVNMEAEALGAVCRDTLRNMYCEVILLDSVDNVDLLAALRKRAKSSPT